MMYMYWIGLSVVLAIAYGLIVLEQKVNEHK